MKKICCRVTSLVEKLDDLPSLFFRLILAYGFYEPAMKKLSDPSSIAAWFESMGLLYPTVQAYLVIATEALGVLFLFFGFATRLISVPLMAVMGGAIYLVHWEHGFASNSNGFEIPLYYFLMLFALFVRGAGRLSVDAWLCCEKNKD